MFPSGRKCKRSLPVMKKITVLLVLSMLSGLLFSSCSQTGSPADDSSDPSGQTTAPDNAGYLYYEGNDLGGTEISILNVAKICANMLCMINPDEIDGETIFKVETGDDCAKLVLVGK